MTQAMVRLMGMLNPSGSRPRNSPGIRPSSQTERERLGSAPIPCTTTHDTTFNPIRSSVAMGVARVGLSSR